MLLHPSVLWWPELAVPLKTWWIWLLDNQILIKRSYAWTSIIFLCNAISAKYSYRASYSASWSMGPLNFMHRFGDYTIKDDKGSLHTWMIWRFVYSHVSTCTHVQSWFLPWIPFKVFIVSRVGHNSNIVIIHTMHV